MWVCVSRENFWFLRINSKPYTGLDVLLRKAEHPFLDHDSYMGCGGDLVEIFEVDLRASLAKQQEEARRGIIGCIAHEVRREICEGIAASPRLSEAKKEVILAELGCAQALSR